MNFNLFISFTFVAILMEVFSKFFQVGDYSRVRACLRMSMKMCRVYNVFVEQCE